MMGSNKNTPKKLSSISFFTPCYNEEKNIEPTIKKALEYLPQISDTYEIIIVNDGSSDNTEKVAQGFANKYDEIKVVSHPVNKGYGAALKTGFTNSRYDWVFFTDGDMQFDLNQLNSFLPFTKDYNVVIGYREQRAEGGVRSFNANLFRYFVDILFGLGVKDIDCAFKLINKDMIDKITLVSDGAFVSAEFLYKFKKLDQEFKEIPVKHYPRKHGNPTGANFLVILKAGKEMVKLFFRLKFPKIFYRQDSNQK